MYPRCPASRIMVTNAVETSETFVCPACQTRQPVDKYGCLLVHQLRSRKSRVRGLRWAQIERKKVQGL